MISRISTVPIQIGFNRRFDNSHKKLQEARQSNEDWSIRIDYH